MKVTKKVILYGLALLVDANPKGCKTTPGPTGLGLYAHVPVPGDTTPIEESKPNSNPNPNPNPNPNSNPNQKMNSYQPTPMKTYVSQSIPSSTEVSQSIPSPAEVSQTVNPALQSSPVASYGMYAALAPIQCRVKIANSTNYGSNTLVTITTSLASVTKSTQVSSQTMSPSSLTKSAVSQKGSEGLTAADVSKHASVSDCYIVYKSNVYDMSAWASSGHPEGPAPIVSYCGKTDGGYATAFEKDHPGKDVTSKSAKNLGKLAV